MKRPTIGIFGATGMVGSNIIQVLYDKEFPIKDLRLYANRSAGTDATTPYGDIKVEHADNANFQDLDLAFFAIGGRWPKDNADKATSSGCYVIDNSSSFRYKKDVPLIIPEINPHAIKGSRLISNPNCTTAIAAIPLFKIYQGYGLNKVIISTYQAASGAGKEAIQELKDQSLQYLKSEKLTAHNFQHPLAYNLIPHIDDFQENLYTKEEMKVVWETRKIFENPNLKISCTCVRVPILRAHSESISVQTKEPIDLESIISTLKDTPGIKVVDEPEKNVYPMPITSSDRYDVEVGRIRPSLIDEKYCLDFFVSGDQILKGAALNSVQIAELLLEKD